MGGEVIFISFFLLVLCWCTCSLFRRIQGRKNFGKKLLVVKDITSNSDLFFGIIFVVFAAPALVTVITFINDPIYFFMFFLAWPIYLIVLSPIYFIKAFSKVEIYEDGILSRDSLWNWDIAEAYSIKEDNKKVTFSFKLNRRFNKSKKIVVLRKDKEKIEKTLMDIFLI